MSNSNFDNKAQKAILNEYDNFYKDISKDDSLYTEYYESYKQDTINDYKNNTNKKCYIDNNGDIYLLTTISFPAGREYADKLVLIK